VIAVEHYEMSETPTLRSRVWNLLGTAHTLGRAGITVAVLAATLSAPGSTVSPMAVLACVESDMLETPEGANAPPIYCQPTADGPTLCPRSFPSA